MDDQPPTTNQAGELARIEGEDPGVELTTKQLAFVDAYCGVAGFNGTQAARIAGYSDASLRAIAHETLTKPYIKAAIAKRMETLAMKPIEVLGRLASIARIDLADLEDAYEVDQETNRRYLSLAKAKELGLGHLIRKVTPTKYGESVELHDPLRALQLLGQNLALFVERIQLSEFDPANLTDEQLAEIARGRK